MKKRQKKKLYYGTRRRRRKIILHAERGVPAPKWTLDLSIKQLARWMHIEGYTINPKFEKLEDKFNA